MKRVLSILFALALVLAFSLVATTPVTAATLYVPGGYPTIQAAVGAAAPGDTIMVAAGTYNEAVTVNKTNLTIQGAGPAATFITTTGATPAFTITVNDITIRDLTITNSTGLMTGILVSIKSGVTQGLTVENVDFTNINAGGPNAHGIYIYNDTSPTAPMSFSRLTIRDCRFRGTNTAAASRNIGILVYPWLNLSNIVVDNCKFSNLMTGVYMGRSSIDGFTFTNNEFGPVEQANHTGAPGGIYIGDSHPDFPTTYQNITVTGNTFHDYNRGVNIWNYANGRSIGRVDITGNTFTNSIASSGVMITARWNAGNASTLEGPITIDSNTFTQNQTILAGSAMIDIRAGIESPTSQIDVTDNTITFSNPTYGNSTYGIKFRGPITNLNIVGNTMDANLVGGASADMPPTSGIVCGSDDTTYGPITGNARVSISCNSIQEFVHGISTYDYVTITYGNLPTGASIDINRNRIIDNTAYGVVSGPGEVTDAEDNWWGDDSGPYHATLNPAGAGDPVSDNVGFTPWVDNSVATTTGTGDASFSADQGNIVGLTGVVPLGAPAAGVTFPHGMLNFTICCIPPGGTVTLTVTLPAAVPVGTVWWKYQNGGWYSLPNLSNDGDAIMVISLTDGGSGDGDAVLGQITDDGGPGNPGAVGWETRPINKVRVLLPWIALIAAIIAGVSLLVLRRRRAQT